MKNRRAVITILFVGMVVVSGSRHSAQAQTYRNAHAGREHDALLKLLAANGKRPFDKLVNNGFKISYEIRGKAVTASVTGNKLSHLRTTKIEQDGSAAVVTAVTKDRALEITTYFLLDEAKQKLTIYRRIKNISPRTVSLKTMREYVDSNLVVKTQYARKRSNLARTVAERIRAGQLIAADSERSILPGVGMGGGDCHCPPPPPPCMTIVCPPDPNYVSGRWLTTSLKRLTFQWKGATILASLRLDGKPALPVNETRFITEVNIR